MWIDPHVPACLPADTAGKGEHLFRSPWLWSVSTEMCSGIAALRYSFCVAAACVGIYNPADESDRTTCRIAAPSHLRKIKPPQACTSGSRHKERAHFCALGGIGIWTQKMLSLSRFTRLKLYPFMIMPYRLCFCKQFLIAVI